MIMPLSTAGGVHDTTSETSMFPPAAELLTELGSKDKAALSTGPGSEVETKRKNKMTIVLFTSRVQEHGELIYFVYII